MTNFEPSTPEPEIDDPYDLRPFVIVHLGASLDGVLWHETADTPYLDLYVEALEAFQADAWLKAVPGAFEEQLTEDSGGPEDDFINAFPGGKYLVLLDPPGTSTQEDWENPLFPGAKPVLVVTRSASADRLQELEDLGISYIFAGKTSLDLELLCWKLKEIFQINALVVTSGDEASRHFADAGVMDELSLMTSPTISGEPGRQAFAPGQAGTAPLALNLVHAQAFDAGLMWTRYQSSAPWQEGQ